MLIDEQNKGKFCVLWNDRVCTTSTLNSITRFNTFRIYFFICQVRDIDETSIGHNVFLKNAKISEYGSKIITITSCTFIQLDPPDHLPRIQVLSAHFSLTDSATNSNKTNNETLTLSEIVAMPKSCIKKEFIIKAMVLEHESMEYQVSSNDSCVKAKLKGDENNNYTCPICKQNTTVTSTLINVNINVHTYLTKLFKCFI